MHGSPSHAPAFLQGTGETGDLIRDYDWASTSIGPVSGWPQSLRTIVGMMLRSPTPMVLLWGEHGVMIYNDPYSVFAAGRHPRLLGSNVLEGWPEVADFNANVMRVGMSGGTLSYRDQELTLFRNGAPEQVWMNLDYGPVIDESGRPGGVLCVLAETSERVLAERRRDAAESALRVSEARLRGVLDGMGESLALLDRDFRIVDMNAEALRLEGRPREEVIGKTHWEAHPNANPELGELFKHAMAHQVPVNLRHRYIWPDGRVSWLIMHAYPVSGGLAVFYGDITKQVEADERVRESETRFRNMADHAPVMMWVTAPDGSCTYLNRLWYEFTGQTEAEAIGLGWLKATHPDDAAHAERVFFEANKDRKAFRIEYRLRHRSGIYKWCIDAATPRFHSDGTFLGYVGSVIDIDERREAEDRLKALTNLVPAFVWFATSDGDIHYFNDRWYQYTGQTEAEALPNGWAATLHPDDRERTAALWADARARGASYGIEMRYRRRDGAYRWYVARAEPYRDANGSVTAWFGTSTDIHDRRVAEEHQKLLINELNHRVKNTLATVQSVVAQTLRNAATPSDAKEAVESRLLALSRAHDVLTRDNWEAADLYEIVQQAVAPYSSKGEDRLHLKGPGVRLPPRMALALAMALQELATNAVKYGALSNTTGEIRIDWSVSASEAGVSLRLQWEEAGGPPVRKPTRRGFGTRLIERSLAQDLGGEVKVTFAPTGLVCTVEAALTTV